jgi:hypothetical protein
MAGKVVASNTPRTAARGDTVVGILRTLFTDLFDPYRPEQHYMRGPGPKWHAKHASAASDAALVGPGLRQAAV